MLVFPDIKPYLFKFNIGSFPLEVRYYGILYIISFIVGYFLVKKNFKYRNIKISDEIYSDFIFYICLGVVIGGRIGYMLFYALSDFLANPLTLLQVWHGGMSFHGGALGVVIFSYIFCKKKNIDYLAIGDCAMPYVAVGLGLGRLGNFINGELWGSITTLPWGVIFPGETQPRHPSQIYEMLLEGVVLFIILQIMVKKSKITGLGFWSFFGIYGIFRFLLEFIRVPDNISSLYPNGLLYGVLPISQGQFLSLFMIIASIIGLVYVVKKHQKK